MTQAFERAVQRVRGRYEAPSRLAEIFPMHELINITGIEI